YTPCRGPAWTGAGDGASGPGRRPDPVGSGELCSGRFPVSRRFSGSTVSLAAQRWLSLSHPPAINYTSDSSRNRKCFRWGVGQFISAVYGSVYHRRSHTGALRRLFPTITDGRTPGPRPVLRALQ